MSRGFAPSVKLCECGCGEPAPIAKRTQAKQGWVKGQPVRFIRGHAARVPENRAKMTAGASTMESIVKRVESRKGYVPNETTKRKIGAKSLGRRHNDTAKARIAEASRGRKQSVATIAKRVVSRNGYTHSKDTRRKIGASNTKHGGSHTRTYQSWIALQHRCNNPNHKDYKHYGGRGITVCERWRAFENFFTDMGKRPEGRTIDRIDVNGNYEPGNCRWATPEQQANNKRRPRRCAV